MIPRFRIVPWIFLLALIGTLTTEVRKARAQTLEEGWSKLDDKYRSVRLRVQEFLRGATRVDPSDSSQLEAIDLLAKTYTWAVYLRKLETDPGALRKEYDVFEGDVDRILKSKDRDTMQPLADVLRDRVRVHAVEVLKRKEARPIHKLYNARVLAKIAELGQPALAATLAEIVKDEQQNNAVHYYALQGMEKLIAQTQGQQGESVVSRDDRLKCAEAIIAFLEQAQKKAPDKNASVAEIDGFRVVRRQAIRALAKIHTPSFNDQVRPALVLARFAGNDERIQPPPRIDERVEAAIGLARMQSEKDRRYQAEYAAGQIAKTLGTLADAANADRENKETHIFPWRVYGSMLKDALETMKKNFEKNEFVVQVASRGLAVANQIAAGTQADANEITWLRSNQSDPPSKELFQGSADSTVKPAQAESEEKPPEK